MDMSLNCNSDWGSYLFVGKCDISAFNISSTVQTFQKHLVKDEKYLHKLLIMAK